MHPVFKSCTKLRDACSPSLDTAPAGIPGGPFKSLDFWGIAAHDRKTLVDRISPYMVARLSRRYSIQTVAADCGWSCSIFSSGTAQTGDDSVSCWRRVVTEFWENPRQTTDNLLMSVRAWFYTLLRYTYRIRFSAQGKRCQSDLILGDLRSCTQKPYTAGLSKRDVHRLTGIPRKYGATFYRSCYKDVQYSSDWKVFCASILWFCKLIHFPTYSDCPEQVLKELRGNLPAVVLQQRWLHTASRIVETSAQVAGTAEDLKRLEERVSCECSSNTKRIEQMGHEIGSLRIQCRKLSLACETMAEAQSKEVRTQQRAWGKQLENLRNAVCKSEARCKKSIAALAEQMKNDHIASDGATALSSLETIVACRWLLETLPDASGKQKGFGGEWGLFWKLQWSQCEQGLTSGKHPLHRVKGEERYNKVGKSLYGTLSTVLHGYGHLRNVPLHPDVRTIVAAISPIHYNKEKQIDIEAERRRWLVGTNKVATKKDVL